MNPANLSAKEVLRLCQPETDMEKRLLDIATELQDDVDGMDDEIRVLRLQVDELDCPSCEDCDNSALKITNAVELIESGKIADGIKLLKDLL